MKPAKERYGWCQGEKFSKSVPEDAFEMLCLILSVLTFLCKTFFELLKFTLLNTLLCGYFLKIYIFK